MSGAGEATTGRGVVLNFAPIEGTGAGGFVQDMTQLEFLR